MASFSRKPKDGTKRQFIIEEKDSPEENPHIWGVNPSYIHVNNIIVIARIIGLGVLIIFYISSLYLLTSQLIISLISGTIILILFILVFHEQLFFFGSIGFFSFRRINVVDPFKNIIFGINKQSPSTIIISNKKDLVHTALKLFRIEVIPENVHASITLFVKALSEYKNMVKFTYQVIQTPIYSQMYKGGSVRTNIYFCVFYTVNGVPTHKRFDMLRKKLDFLGNTLRNNFIGNFHHFKIALLSGTALVNGLRTYFFKTDSPLQEERSSKKIDLSFIIKLIFCCGIVVFSGILLGFLKTPFLFIFLINLVLIIILMFLWWRESLYMISRNSALENYIIVNPFNNTLFFRHRGISDTLFAHINNNLLLGIKMFNLTFAFPPPYCNNDKFIQSIMNQKVSFGYTSINSPIQFPIFYDEGLDFLTRKTINDLLNSPWRVQTTIDEINWLAIRAGVWRTMLNISAIEFKQIDSLDKNTILNLEEQLVIKAEILQSAFNSTFFNYRLVQLRREKLVTGVMCEILKNNEFTLTGTHLSYLLFQGKSLIHLIEIVDVLKKGVTMRIASEFNTPLNLQNNIIMGNTVNTEVLEEEMPFGFTLEQVQNVLISNGTAPHRELFMMKLISELAIEGIPALVFDYKGTWSKLLTYFKGTKYEDRFLYFKLGKAFILDPLKSDIPYDKDNADFLEYMFDVYAMAFRKDQRTVDMVRTTILQNPDIDMTSLNLKLINEKDWEKSPGSDSLISLFGDFTQQDEQYLHIAPTEPSGAITFKDFISDNKTVIVDLSISNDYTKQTFLTFLIISKIIHYLKTAQDDEYCSKIISIPHVDLFFNSIFIDRKSDYGKINKFLDPLKEKGFGFIFSANQAHYLHTNLINYFENFIAFNTRDKRDIAALSNFMNMQELEGIGYYSQKRNQTYQIPYIMSLQNNEAVVKRSDMYQVFPVQIEWEQIEKNPLMSNEEIITFMEKQGYDLKDAESKLLEQIKKTLFEKDFGIYFGFTQEIKEFFETISKVDQIAGLSKKKIKNELKTAIYPKASRHLRSKVEVKKTRDEIFKILVKQGYLEESHMKTAGGSESLPTCFSVGPQYKKALEDEFESEYSIETVESDSGTPFEFLNQDQPRKFIVQEGNLRIAIAREFSTFYFELFTIYEFIEHKEYKNALRVEQNIIHRFLVELYKQYHNVENVESENLLNTFIDTIVREPEISFSKEEIRDFLGRYSTIDFDHINLEEKAIEIYEFICIFFDKLQIYLNKEE